MARFSYLPSTMNAASAASRLPSYLSRYASMIPQVGVGTSLLSTAASLLNPPAASAGTGGGITLGSQTATAGGGVTLGPRGTWSGAVAPAIARPESTPVTGQAAARTGRRRGGAVGFAGALPTATRAGGYGELNEAGIAELARAETEARAANEARYGEILEGYRGRYSEAMSALEGLGEQEASDIRQDYTKLEAQQQQDLTSRGLTGTTILPSMRTGVARERTDALARLDETIRRERLSLQTGLSRETLEFMERREDEYPDTQAYLNALQASGRYGDAMAGGTTGAAAAGGKTRGFTAEENRRRHVLSPQDSARWAASTTGMTTWPALSSSFLRAQMGIG